MGQFPDDRCDDKVRVIQGFHMDTRGWNDIAYSFVVCPHGNVFEGRGWGVRTAAQGTNAGNSHFHAVCFLGGKGDPVTDAAKAAISAVRAELVRRLPRATDVKPHSWFHSTACPGPALRIWLARKGYEAVSEKESQPVPPRPQVKTPAPAPKPADSLPDTEDDDLPVIAKGPDKPDQYVTDLGSFKRHITQAERGDLIKVLKYVEVAHQATLDAIPTVESA
jgi:hypothetical protein